MSEKPTAEDMAHDLASHLVAKKEEKAWMEGRGICPFAVLVVDIAAARRALAAEAILRRIADAAGHGEWERVGRLADEARAYLKGAS